MDEQKVVTLSLTNNEVFNLYLALMCKTGFLSQKLSCAGSQDEANSADKELGVCNALLAKIQTIMKDQKRRI